ncbi:MAG: lytic transglycosylase domain-containing protein [Betaproteobacteria bacterium]
MSQTRISPQIDFRKELFLVIAAAVVTGAALGAAAYAAYHAMGLRAEVMELRRDVKRLEDAYKDLLGEASAIKAYALAHNSGLAPARAGEIAAEVVKQSRLHGLAPAFVAAVITAESGWRPGAVSAAGAVGLMQIMPATARGLGIDPHDWRQNLAGGVRYLKALVDRFGHVEVALAAYNAGPTRISRAGPGRAGRERWPRATRAYVNRVMQAQVAKEG